MGSTWRRTTLLFLSVALAAACSNAPTTTELFDGTLARQSSAEHAIVVAADGEIAARLISTDPMATLGLGIGHPSSSDGSCRLEASNDAARAWTVVSTGVTPGSYCVSVYDAGNLSAPVSYSLTVTHP